MVVVCNHSPKSKQWEKVNNKGVLETCCKVAQQTHGADTPKPQASILCGDFNLEYISLTHIAHMCLGSVREWVVTQNGRN